MTLKLLLVDPDQDWLSAAANFFKGQMYDVDYVNNGRDAQLALYNSKYFAVILNSETQNHSAIQVIKFIKTNHPGQRVVLIINNKEKIAQEFGGDKLEKLGITESIIKPFELADLASLLEGHQKLSDWMGNLPKRDGSSKEEDVSLMDSKFSSVRIDEFYSTQAVLFDVFIKLKENHYTKILHAGDTFSKDRIDRYKNEKKVEYLYFLTSDRRKYVQFTNFLAKKLVSSKVVAADNKVNMLKNVSTKFVEEVFSVGLKPQVVEMGKEICANIYNVVDSQPDLYKVLKDYQNFDPNSFTHAYLVTLFSSSIIKQFEWQSKSTIETTALACMFHDIGKMKLPEKFLELDRMSMNDGELQEYKKHPEIGAQLIEGNRLINNTVKQIILQHHEYYDGSGFPFGLKGKKILTLANIVCLADEFVHIILRDKVKPVDALKKILTQGELVGKFNSSILENFIKVFVDPTKVTKENVLPSNSRMVPNAVSTATAGKKVA